MIGKILMRGMLVGLIAGILAFGFAKFFGEPSVDRAIAFEDHEHQVKQHHDMMAGKAPEPDEPELFSRDVQSGIGLFTGVMAYSAGIGGLFSLVFAYAYGRVGNMRPRTLSALLAAAGFIAVILAPMLKYPANPPSIGNPDTIVQRSNLFFAMLSISVLGMVGSIKLGRALSRTLGQWHASIAGALAFALIITVALFALPPINEVPEGFPADLLWNFRLASLGMHLLLWSVLGVVFGEWTERSLQQVGNRQTARYSLS
ncbi:membrane protein [Aquitalea magnusonii]|nr:membrane protein [Aquitalea magnusonii]